MIALDRLYLESTGQRFCETCGRPFDGETSPLLTRAIADYLLAREEAAGYRSTSSRLAHVIEYIASTDSTVTCAQIDEAWVNKFRKSFAAKPVTKKDGTVIRDRSISHVEQCVLQLAAAINATPGQTARFRNVQLIKVAASPRYRGDVKILAAAFRYCLYPEGRSEKEIAFRFTEREQLLDYLRAAVATWARPEEIFDLTDKQWTSAAGVLDLNPPGRRQTRKYRTTVAVPRQFAPRLDAMVGNYMKVVDVNGPWRNMRTKIGMPVIRGEAGPKLIRRTMATLVRKAIGEANWRQGEMMLGHVKHSISDIYAIPDPANLGLALAATEAIIDEIEGLCPGAFLPVYRNYTALRVVNGGKGKA